MTPLAVGMLLAISGLQEAPEDRLAFDRTIPRETLERYLSRAITEMDLLTGVGDADDNIRMLREIGALFAGRTIYLWGGESQLPQKLNRAREIAAKIHEAIPNMILQAGIFEIVTTQVAELPVPAWVFEAFGTAPVERCFRYEDMLFPDGRFKNHWSVGCSVPDVTSTETKMWFVFLAGSFIDLGVEAIHMGQESLIGAADPGRKHWWEVLTRIRSYASKRARRHLVLLDAHTPQGGPLFGEDLLLFDFHSFPLRIEEVPDHPQEGVLKMGYLDSLFGRSAGGITPSGWRCEHLPFIVELDNFEPSGKEGQNIGGHWIWGYDEICWFAHQPPDYRNRWLRYAWDWVREHDPNGYLQMPGSRCLAVPVEGKGSWYFANRESDRTPHGFGQEDAIQAIWSEEGRP